MNAVLQMMGENASIHFPTSVFMGPGLRRDDGV